MSKQAVDPGALVFTENDHVQVVARSASGDPSINASAATPGDYRVFLPVEAHDGDDPDRRAYYLLDNEHSSGGSFWAYPEHVVRGDR